ncbi:hypothetical protein D3C72_1352860 [compost metagenome]
MKTRHRQKGQALIEAVFALPVLFAALAALAMMAYYSLVYYSADYLLHEALVCSTHLSRQTCERELRKQLQGVLPAGKVLDLRLQGSGKQSRGSLLIKLIANSESKKTEMKISKTIELPF